MFNAYLFVTLLAAAANIFSAVCDFVRYRQVSIAMAKAGVPDAWMTMLGILKAAGALGLVIGLGVPLIGTAAAVGLVLFFVAAIFTHLRAHDYSISLAVVFLLLAVAVLVLGLHARGSAAMALVFRP
jgi:DoxX-like protein